LFLHVVSATAADSNSKHSGVPSERWRKLAENAKGGDNEACFELAHLYLMRFDTSPEELKISQKEGRRLLETAAAAGHAKSMNNLGVMFKDGLHGAERNDVLAVKWFAEAAEMGDLAAAELNLGIMLMKGRGVPEPDERLGISMLHRAANNGDEDAMMWLAKIYADGNGTSGKLVQNASESLAMDWLKKAAAKGHKKAEALLKHDEL